MRLDVYLAESGTVKSRTRALELIKAGLVTVNGKSISKASFEVDETDEVVVDRSEHEYVSRAALKLKYASEMFGISFKGLVAADLGSSTGGFCQVMLEDGISEVYAVDIGHGQLHPSVAANKKVHVLEGVNARYLDADVLTKKVDIVTSDLSFISQTLVLESIARILNPGGMYIGLIKPQFEAGRGNIGKHGLVKDKRVHADVIERVVTAAAAYGFECVNLTASPILGGDGNREFLARYEYKDSVRNTIGRRDIEKIVEGDGGVVWKR